jgi:arylsulfatase A
MRLCFNVTFIHLGKWHLGQRPEHLPTKRGFDHYLGIPYSNDMGLSRWRKHWSGPPCTPLPLLRNETIIEQPTDLSTLTPRYTAEAVDFISRHADGDRPFFLYMAYNHVHTPIFCSKEWCNTSQRGIYGDGVSEMDASIGSIMDIVRARGLSGSTLVIFTSDNGPWLTQEIHSGSAGLLREGKGSTWEGGIREPAIAWWPGHVPAGKVTTEVANTMDIFPTVLRLVGIPLPPNRVFDGKDISNILFGNCPTDDSAEAVRDGPVCSPHEFMFHYRGTPNPEKPDKEPGLWAVRWTESRFKQWKVHFVTKSGFKHDQPVFHNPPLLFNLVSDPGEHYPLNITSPELHYILPKVMAAVAQHQATLSPVKNQDIGLDCPKYCLCCDWNSQKKYPQYPPCTCNPNNW